MASNSQVPLYNFSYEDDPHASIEEQRRQAEAAESEDEEASDSEDDLEKSLMAGFEDSDEEEISRSSVPKNDLPTATNTSSPKTTQGAAALLTATYQTFAEVRAHNEHSEESDEFEDVPLNFPISAATTTTTSAPTNDFSQALLSNTQIGQLNADVRTTQPVNTTNRKILKGTKTVLNFPDLVESGAGVRYKESLPVEHTYAYTSDKTIEPHDPYYAKGCLRRMIFESDHVPEHQRYRAQNAQSQKKSNDLEFPNAVDKAHDWCRTRRGVFGATPETIEDGKMARHFVLRMGPPHGPNAEATRIAGRLKTLVSHYFFSRLAKSHLMIETEIPYHELAGEGYFRSYMEAIRELISPPPKTTKKLGERLRIVLADESTQKFRNCDPACFYPRPFDYEAEWRNRVGSNQHIFTEIYPSTQQQMPYEWQPTSDQYEFAKRAYLTRGQIANEQKPAQVDAAIVDIKLFVEQVERFQNPKAASVQSEGAQKPLKWSSQYPSMAASQGSALGKLHSEQWQRATTAQPALATSPTHATAVSPLMNEAQSRQQQLELGPGLGQIDGRRQAQQMLLGAQAVQNRPHAVGPSSGNTPHVRMVRNELQSGREDWFTSTMSFDAPNVSFQQPAWPSEQMRQQYWQQQYHIQQYQAHLWTQQGPPAAHPSAHALVPALTTSSGSTAGATGNSVGLLNMSTTEKRGGESGIDDGHLEKRPRE